MPGASAPSPTPRPAPRRRGWTLWVLLVLVAVATLIAGGLVVAKRLRSRTSASERAALRDLRSVVVAELRYSQSNAGHYDRLECLRAPARCLPRYPAGARAFLETATFGTETRGDYHFVFHPGPAPARGAVDATRLSPSSIAAFAYVAAPALAGSRLRSFCADSTGRLCVLRAADAPDLTHGVCPLACVDLR
jgi:hypothetical protein